MPKEFAKLAIVEEIKSEVKRRLLAAAIAASSRGSLSETAPSATISDSAVSFAVLKDFPSLGDARIHRRLRKTISIEADVWQVNIWLSMDILSLEGPRMLKLFH
jgi:hypothetical protein